MENKSARAKVQAFGGFLTAMVIPNIGAFIAWGFITALFIPTGWLPNEHFAKIVGPMITYLLPVMIGSTGGHLVGGKRGAVMGGIGTIGVIVGAEIDLNIVGMDVVEVAPAYDQSEITALAAATLALEMLYIQAAKKGE